MLGRQLASPGDIFREVQAGVETVEGVGQGAARPWTVRTKKSTKWLSPLGALESKIVSFINRRKYYLRRDELPLSHSHIIIIRWAQPFGYRPIPHIGLG